MWKHKITLYLILFSLAVCFFRTFPVSAKTYTTYQQVIQSYDSTAYSGVWYNYLKLQTPKGKKKVLAMTAYEGHFAVTDLYYKTGKSVEKYAALSGNIIQYDPEGTCVLTCTYAGASMGDYAIYEYRDDSFVETARESFDEYGDYGEVITYAQALETLEAKTGMQFSKMHDFDAAKYKHQTKIAVKYVFVNSLKKTKITYYLSKESVYGLDLTGSLKSISMSEDATFYRLPDVSGVNDDSGHIKTSFAAMKKLVKKYRKQQYYMYARIQYKKVDGKNIVIRFEEMLTAG